MPKKLKSTIASASVYRPTDSFIWKPTLRFNNFEFPASIAQRLTVFFREKGGCTHASRSLLACESKVRFLAEAKLATISSTPADNIYIAVSWFRLTLIDLGFRLFFHQSQTISIFAGNRFRKCPAMRIYRSVEIRAFTLKLTVGHTECFVSIPNPETFIRSKA